MRRRRSMRELSQLSLMGSVGLAALAGFALGALLMQQRGSIGGALQRLQTQASTGEADDDSGPPDSVYEMDQSVYDDSAYGDAYGDSEDDFETESDEYRAATELEERVLLTFRNDPVLATAEIEITGESDGLVRLGGRVTDPTMARHAAILTAGVPGVVGVANNIRVRRSSRA